MRKDMLNNQKTPNEHLGFHIEGHIKIFDPDTGECFQNRRNAIHFENMSVALVTALSSSTSVVDQMVFGNGGTVVDPSGLITYLTPNVIGTSAGLYSQTYDKPILSTDIEVQHLTGTTYSDLVVSCLLDLADGPVGMPATDGGVASDDFVFDELGLRSNGKLLTHVIFHPVLKSLNRRIQIDYVVRIQTSTLDVNDQLLAIANALDEINGV